MEDEVAQAMLLAFWDGQNQETLRMDLWVKEMPVDQMKMFFHQTLLTMSDTYLRATQDEKMTATMKDFCDYFAEKTQSKKRQLKLRNTFVYLMNVSQKFIATQSFFLMR